MDILQEAIKAVKEAGKEVLKVYGSSGFSVRDKGENDPVTKADLASERIILQSLKRFDYGILSEESTDNPERLNKDRVWIIDPLDGTHNFMRGIDIFGVSLGLWAEGSFVLGVVYMPKDKELYWALKGKGAYKNGKKIYRILQGPPFVGWIFASVRRLFFQAMSTVKAPRARRPLTRPAGQASGRAGRRCISPAWL